MSSSKALSLKIFYGLPWSIFMKWIGMITCMNLLTIRITWIVRQLDTDIFWTQTDTHSTDTCTVALCVIERWTHQKIDSFKILKFPRRRNSNSNLLINIKFTEIVRIGLGPNGKVKVTILCVCEVSVFEKSWRLDTVLWSSSSTKHLYLGWCRKFRCKRLIARRSQDVRRFSRTLDDQTVTLCQVDQLLGRLLPGDLFLHPCLHLQELRQSSPDRVVQSGPLPYLWNVPEYIESNADLQRSLRERPQIRRFPDHPHSVGYQECVRVPSDANFPVSLGYHRRMLDFLCTTWDWSYVERERQNSGEMDNDYHGRWGWGWACGRRVFTVSVFFSTMISNGVDTLRFPRSALNVKVVRNWKQARTNDMSNCDPHNGGHVCSECQSGSKQARVNCESDNDSVISAAILTCKSFVAFRSACFLQVKRMIGGIGCVAWPWWSSCRTFRVNTLLQVSPCHHPTTGRMRKRHLDHSQQIHSSVLLQNRLSTAVHFPGIEPLRNVQLPSYPLRSLRSPYTWSFRRAG